MYRTKPLSLPEPTTDKLKRSPLVLVVCQVRFEKVAAAADAGRALAIQGSLVDRLPNINEHEQRGVVLTPAGTVEQQPPVKVWQFKSTDQTTTASISPDFVSLETSDYSDWSDFSGLLHRLLQGVGDELKPKIEQRVGLRYVDQLMIPTQDLEAELRKRLSPELLGPLVGAPFGESVIRSQQVLEIDGPQDLSVLFRHGIDGGTTPNEAQYVLDYDCFSQTGRAFEIANLKDQLEKLHRLALQVFQATLLPAYFSTLGSE
jgi:uncharacterized protein (TIGR04255 family)